MKKRILKNWSIVRVLYVIIGLSFFFQSIADKQWLGIVIGLYFAAMGVFAFGCASGNCYGDACETEQSQQK